MIVVGYILEGLVAVLAGLLARRRAYHRAVALYLGFVALSDPLRAFLRTLRPYSGLGAMAFPMRSLSGLLFVAAPIGLATACAASWAPKLWPHVLGAGALAAVVGLVWMPKGYPAGYLLDVQAASQLIGWGMFGWELRRGRRHWASSYTVALILCLASDAAYLLGPYLGDVFRDWMTGLPAIIAMNVALVALHASWLTAGGGSSASRGASAKSDRCA